MFEVIASWVFSARPVVVGGKCLTGVSLSWAQKVQQIDSPCLLPFSTDRLRAWALSQHYQSIRSYPQPLTLIGGQLPKRQGSMNHSSTMRSWYASKYMCCGKNPFLVSALKWFKCLPQLWKEVVVFRRHWGCWGRGIVGLGLVFLVWSETCVHLCPSPTQT